MNRLLLLLFAFALVAACAPRDDDDDCDACPRVCCDAQAGDGGPEDAGGGAAQDAGEDDDAGGACDACPPGCDSCEEPAPTCGDGTCNGDEDCEACASDCGACAWPAEWEAREQRMLELVNEARASGAECPSGFRPATHPLTYNEELTWAARLHSADMGEQGYFDHTSLDGREFSDRIEDAGYDAFPAAENIAAGNATAEATFAQWMGSDGHCRNIMSANANELGVGYAHVEGSPFQHYWTQNFGRR